MTLKPRLANGKKQPDHRKTTSRCVAQLMHLAGAVPTESRRGRSGAVLWRLLSQATISPRSTATAPAGRMRASPGSSAMMSGRVVAGIRGGLLTAKDVPASGERARDLPDAFSPTLRVEASRTAPAGVADGARTRGGSRRR